MWVDEKTGWGGEELKDSGHLSGSEVTILPSHAGLHQCRSLTVPQTSQSLSSFQAFARTDYLLLNPQVSTYMAAPLRSLLLACQLIFSKFLFVFLCMQKVS